MIALTIHNMMVAIGIVCLVIPAVLFMRAEARNSSVEKDIAWEHAKKFVSVAVVCLAISLGLDPWAELGRIELNTIKEAAQ